MSRWIPSAMVALATTGCDVAFGLDGRDAAIDVPVYDPCSAQQQADDPLRYATLLNPNGAGLWGWSAARTTCRERGMDLAVVNDERELHVTSDATLPLWLGASRTTTGWASVDGCPAMMPTGGTAETCAVLADAGKIEASACDGAFPSSEGMVVHSALCETPRPQTAACAGNDPATTTYTMSPAAMSFPAARAWCSERGGHPVVVETHAEWLALATMVHAELRAAFWVASTFDGAQWTADTGCPALYAWAEGGPSRTPVAGDCAGAIVRDSTDEDAPGLVLAGVDAMACTAELRALCEP